MTCVLEFGEHGSEHFVLERNFTPPSRILVQTQTPSDNLHYGPPLISVYGFDRMKKDMAVFDFKGVVENKRIKGLIKVVDFQ